MCPQKNSIGALPREEVACPDCPMTNILPEMPSQEAGRILHHVRWQHPPFGARAYKRVKAMLEPHLSTKTNCSPASLLASLRQAARSSSLRSVAPSDFFFVSSPSA